MANPNVREYQRENQRWPIQTLENTKGRIKDGQSKENKAKTQHNTRRTPLHLNKHKQHKQDMTPPTNKTWPLPQTRYDLSHKQDMTPPTNKTWPLPQTRHDLSHKQDMTSPTNKIWPHPQTRHDPSHKQLEAKTNRTVFYAEIVTDITTRNSELKNT